MKGFLFDENLPAQLRVLRQMIREGRRETHRPASETFALPR